jgi:hypothetical protein
MTMMQTVRTVWCQGWEDAVEVGWASGISPGSAPGYTTPYLSRFHHVLLVRAVAVLLLCVQASATLGT